MSDQIPIEENPLIPFFSPVPHVELTNEERRSAIQHQAQQNPTGFLDEYQQMQDQIAALF